MPMWFHNPIKSILDETFGTGSSEVCCWNTFVKRGRIGDGAIGRGCNVVSSGLVILFKYF